MVWFYLACLMQFAMPSEIPDEALDRWVLALEASETGAWELNLLDGSTWRSRLHDQIFGYPEGRPDWSYRVFLQHVIEEDRHWLDRAFNDALEDRGVLRFECRIRRADGEQRWISVRGRVHCDERQQPALIWGTVQDVTERKRVEHELLESERRYRALFESMREGFCVIEKVRTASGARMDFRYVSANPAFETQTGLENPLGKTIRELLPMEPEEWFDILDEVLRTGEPARFERELVTQGRVLDLHAFRVPGEGSRRVAVIFRDITESKRTERALREADRQKDEFLATLAHELRNPLAPIQSGIDYLRLATDDGAGKARVMEMMNRQIGSLKRLVDDLLDISRITRGRLTLQTAPVDLRALVRDAAAIETASMVREVRVDLPSRPIVIAGDDVRLRQIIDNLLDNAVKFTKDGGEIEVSLCEREDNAVLSVKDYGIGMEPEVLRKVFEMFFQTRRPEHTEGLGIGLSLVNRLVQLHGGRIEARSGGPGRGSEFEAWFPLLQSQEEELPMQHEDARPERSGQRILVMDDNVDAAESLAMLLQAMGAEVKTAHDGASALEVFEEFRPQLALLDIGMQGMNGYEVASAMRDRAQGKSLRLVAVTGWGQPDDKARAREAGFDDHLTKPVETENLRRLLRS